MNGIQDYNCVSIRTGGQYAGMIRYYLDGHFVASETGGVVYEDDAGIHFLLPNSGRRTMTPPRNARTPDPLGVSRKVIHAVDFREDLMRQIMVAVNDNEPMLDEVSELFGTRHGTLRMHRTNNRSSIPVWSANFLVDCPEADSFLTWLASYMCNFRRPFRAGERLEGHAYLPEVLGDRAWSCKAVSWKRLMEQAVWIYMEVRKSLLPVQQEEDEYDEEEEDESDGE